MRKYLLTTLIATAAALAGQADGFCSQASTSKEAVTDTWKDAVAQYREKLARLAKEDPRFLDELDAFEHFVSGLAKMKYLSDDQKKEILEKEMSSCLKTLAR